MSFVVWCPDYGQEMKDGTGILASSPERAALVWAEEEDAYNQRYTTHFRIAEGIHSPSVMVLDTVTGVMFEVEVTGKLAPRYSATIKGRKV